MFQRDPARVAFYHSRAWEATRDAYLASKMHICERCGRTAKVVHHKTYLTAENVGDLTTALGFENLEALCMECHNREHFGSQAVAEGLRFTKDGNIVAIDS